MSFGGMLAAGIAGGAKAYGEQLTKDIGTQTEEYLARQKAAIMEESRMREMEYQERLRQQGRMAEVKGPLAEATLAHEAAKGEIAGKQQVKTAAALAEEGRRQTVLSGQNKEYLDALTATKLADPLVKAQIDQARAAAGASAASTRLHNEQARQLGELGQTADLIRDYQTSLAGTTDPEARATIQQRIADLGFTQKNVDRFLGVIDKAQDNIREALKIETTPGATTEQMAEAKRLREKAQSLIEAAAEAGGIKLKDTTKPESQDDANALLRNSLTAAKTQAQRDQIMAVAQQSYRKWGYTMPDAATLAKPAKPKAGKSGGGMLDASYNVPGGQGSDEIAELAAGYGTKTYRYRGEDYGSRNEAEQAKFDWNKAWYERQK